MSEKADVQGCLKQAESRVRKEQYEMVTQLCSKILEFEPRNPSAYYFRANAKNELENFAGAIMDFTAVLEWDSENIMARIRRSQIAEKIEIKDKEKALNDFPAYCKKIREEQEININTDVLQFPLGGRAFHMDALTIYLKRARQAETETRIDEAIHYWQAFYDIGGAFDGSPEDVLARIEKLKKQKNETTE